jgi:hypothetical protein
MSPNALEKLNPAEKRLLSALVHSAADFGRV